MKTHGIACRASPTQREARLAGRVVRGPDERARTEASIPLGRYGTTGEIVNWMLFPACDEAAYMTGQTVTVNGGRLMV